MTLHPIPLNFLIYEENFIFFFISVKNKRNFLEIEKMTNWFMIRLISTLWFTAWKLDILPWVRRCKEFIPFGVSLHQEKVQSKYIHDILKYESPYYRCVVHFKEPSHQIRSA
jgi:hypothetical protein